MVHPELRSAMDQPLDRMREFVRRFWKLNRTAVNEDSDRLVNDIRWKLDCSVIESPSGSECLTWLVPKRWHVRDGYLARLDGTRIVDFRENPLHLWTHSIPFKGVIKRQDLEGHLYHDPKKPHWVPYHYRNGYRYDAREWGFSLSHAVYKTLSEDEYIVEIDTDIDNEGSLKVVDYWLKGEQPDTIFVAAHTCHPGQATDGLTNVAVALELFHYLKGLDSRQNSYRLILGPEYFAAAAFLSRTPQSEIDVLRGGLFLDMFGSGEPFGFQFSYNGNSRLDRAVANVFAHQVRNHIRRPYRKFLGNDEMFYNGPGFLIPTVGIGCDLHAAYHSSKDDFDSINWHQLTKGLELCKKIIEVLETDFVPVPRFRGPLYLSRFDLYIDPKVDQKGYDGLEHIQILMNGIRSCLDIAQELDIDFFFVRSFCERLLEKQLAERKPAEF